MIDLGSLDPLVFKTAWWRPVDIVRFKIITMALLEFIDDLKFLFFWVNQHIIPLQPSNLGHRVQFLHLLWSIMVLIPPSSPLTVMSSRQKKMSNNSVWGKCVSEVFFRADFKSGIKTWKKCACFFQLPILCWKSWLWINQHINSAKKHSF